MTCKVTLPTGTRAVSYGAISLQPQNDEILVPAYLAKTLTALPGVTADPVPSGSIPDLLQAGEAFETAYMLGAWGQRLPYDPSQRITAAVAIFNDKGEPPASLA